MMKENQFLTSWLKIYHPEPPLWIRPRLGKVAFPEFAKMLSVKQRYPDAVIISEGAVIIIEAKLEPIAEAVGQLKLYKQLFYETPEFRPWWGFPIRLLLLTTREDKEIMRLCDEEEIGYLVHADCTIKEDVP